MSSGSTIPRPGPVARLLIIVVSGYRRWLGPLLGPRCRFAPTCSAFALEALSLHGAARGSWLTLRRVLRCQPFCSGGHDPVPPVRPSWVTMDARPRPRRTGADPC